MVKRICLLLYAFLFAAHAAAIAAEGHPNVIVILGDDIGYGDLSCYSPVSKIDTPNLDKLAAQGLRFTDAHSPGSLCTPSRFGLLTGTYCWRTHDRNNIYKFGPPIIKPEHYTLGHLFRDNGYRTGLIGKWHLGLHFTAKPGKKMDFNPERYARLKGNRPDLTGKVDLSVPVTGGPNDLGFEYSFHTTNSPTSQEPYCFIEDGRFLNYEDATYRKPNGAHRAGMVAPDWDNRLVDDVFTEKAIGFIESSVETDRPFFLNLPFSSAHSPHVVPEFVKSKTGAGLRGDLVWWFDFNVGRIVDALNEHEIAQDTLLIVTSDNGPLRGSILLEGKEGSARISNGHKSAGSLNGFKGSVLEGGHRVPFIIRWPNHIKPATVSDQSIDLVDVMASLAGIIGQPLPDHAGADSIDRSGIMIADGKQQKQLPLVHHAGNGQYAIRDGDWKMIMKPKEPNIGSAIFNLKDDLSESKNLLGQSPDREKVMAATLKQLKETGRRQFNHKEALTR